MDADPLVRSLKLGSMVLPNRVVMTTVKLGYGTEAGEVTDRHVAFYTRRARGGVGLLTTEPLYVQRSGREVPTQLSVASADRARGLEWLVASVHGAGGRIMAHLNHAGRAANPKLVPEGVCVSASEVPCPANGVTPRALSVGEIEGVIEAFADAASRVASVGFDAVEVPFSHGYLIHQFLSPRTNRRDDGYGGTFDARLRFGREVLSAVRDRIGTLPLVVRMNATDHVDGGLDESDAVAIATALEGAGVDGLSITSGTMCESVPFCLYPAGTPKAHLLPMSERIRRAVAVPVIVAGRIRSPQVARAALTDGQTDVVGLARPLLADPDWVRKAVEGDEESILLCAACHQGCLADLRKGAGTHCAFNPLTGRESEIEVTPAQEPRRVAVVGGGPAGLEAARVAADRGHAVTLFEQSDRLGGQLELASRTPHKEEFADVIRHFVLMAERAGVDIELGTRATAEGLTAEDPDAVVVATGGVPLPVEFPGLEKTHWLRASDLLEGTATVPTRSALVVGGGLVGLETADYLTARGVDVTVVELLDRVGGEMDPLARSMLLGRLENSDVVIHTGVRVVRLTPAAVVAEKNGREIMIGCETVVLAVGVRSDRELAEALEGSGLPVYVVGDAVEPRGAGAAIREGFEAAIAL